MAATYNSSRLLQADADAVQDLICVGFGPASLAIAVALHDALDAGTIQSAPKVLFLEKQARFSWHAGMLLPGAKMQISFIKDLATLRDPRSAFTFVNYLFRHGRLVEFTNLSTFLPARSEYEDYLRWCAKPFDDAVRYSNEVLAVEAETAAPVATFRVVARHVQSGEQHVYRARNVLIATGGKPSLPPCLPSGHPRVLHSSQYAHLVPTLLPDSHAPYRVAVVGAGQSAAEIFNNIQVLYPKSRTYLVMRSAFLRPSDDSPFVNSIFNPDYVDSLYARPDAFRRRLLAEARPTNYGVVRLDLIEALYERMYHQGRELGKDETKWPHRILGSHSIIRTECPEKDDGLRLVVQPEEGGGVQEPAGPETETLDVDLIIAATGYQRRTHVTLLEGLWPLLPEEKAKAASGGINGTAGHAAGAEIGTWTVDDQSAGGKNSVSRVLGVSRDYRVEFAPDQVAAGSGIWLQGCCEGTHGLSDTLLSVLATRSGEIVASIFGKQE